MSRDSSMIIENNASPISLIIILIVSIEVALTISFWISGEVNLTFSRAFVKVIVLISSLWSARNFKSSRKLPWCFGSSDLSQPQNASPCCKRSIAQSTHALRWIWYSFHICFDCLRKNVWICYYWFIKASHLFRASLCALLGPLTWI